MAHTAPSQLTLHPCSWYTGRAILSSSVTLESARLALAPSEIDPLEQQLTLDIVEATGDARRPSTMAGYDGPFLLFVEWCGERKPPRVPLPASEATTSLYLQFVAGTASSFAVVKTASAAIYCAHVCALIPEGLIPTKSQACKQIRAAARNRLGAFAPGRGKKEPLEWEHVTAIVAIYCPLAGFTLASLTAGTMIAVMFAGFLRYDCSVQIFADEVKFYIGHMELFMETRKNQKLREGDVLVIARGSGPSCPVTLVARLISAAKLEGKHVALFQKFDGHKPLMGPKAPPLSGQKMSYGQCRTQVHNALFKVLGAKSRLEKDAIIKMFGTQSLRSGGATAVAHTVDDRLFQRHGAWKSVAVKNEYVKDSLETRLSVTKAIPGY